ncbi:MAG: hypothetical protein QOJ42_2562 [Acidobacteriaceae bacterium]|jgi:hypothetical protein|nr:hypothetical protein [Acidobacteriaceae bacterium]
MKKDLHRTTAGSLNLDEAIAHVDYTRGDLRFHRESFVSNPEVVRRALARHEEKLHQLSRGIVDEDQQGASCAPILEPAVLAAVGFPLLVEKRNFVDDYYP